MGKVRRTAYLQPPIPRIKGLDILYCIARDFFSKGYFEKQISSSGNGVPTAWFYQTLLSLLEWN